MGEFGAESKMRDMRRVPEIDLAIWISLALTGVATQFPEADPFGPVLALTSVVFLIFMWFER